MSLTSFLKNKDVQEKFKVEFDIPIFELNGELKASPLTKNYSLMGTAFDYIMRFYLKRENPMSVTKDWVAENAIEFIQDKKLKKKAQLIIKEAKVNYKKYLKNGNMTDEIIRTCICLAQLDPIYRASYIDEEMGEVSELDIQDMKNCFALIKLPQFRAKKICLLNPTFGKASGLVGGADTDLVIDDTLIDIKTTKFLILNRDHFNQIIGYYFLYLIGCLDGAPKEHKINNIGIYFSRYGLLYIFPVEKVILKEKVRPFIKWLKNRAKRN